MSVVSVQRTALRTALRAWLVSATGLADGKVIFPRQDGPRPDLPYITVNLTTNGVPVGQDEDVPGVAASEPTTKTRGRRTALVSVNGYGTATYDLLEAARLALRTPAIVAALNTAGVSVAPLGGIQDLSELVDTSFEDRFLLEVEANFVVESATAALVRADEAVGEITLDRFEGAPDALEVDATFDVSP